MDATEFIILLLGKARGYLEGETKIHKFSFLGLKEHNVPLSTSFMWSHWGPFSVQIRDDLSSLERMKLIQIGRETRRTSWGDEYIVNTYRLTEEGKRFESDLKEKIPISVQQNIDELYRRFGSKRLSEILDYVHRIYSPMDM